MLYFIKKKIPVSLFLWGIVILLAMPGLCQATDFTWTGAEGNSSWTNSLNWSGGSGTDYPASSTDNVTIPAGLSIYPAISTPPVFINNINIQSGASLDLTTGSSLSMSGICQVGGTLTISGSVFMSPALQIQGSGLVNASGTALQNTVLTITSLGISPGGTLSVQGYALLTLSQDASIEGILDVQGISGGEGKVVLNGTGTVRSGGVVRLSSGGSLDIIPLSPTSGDGILVIEGDGVPATPEGLLSINGGMVNLDSLGTLTSNGVIQWNNGGISPTNPESFCKLVNTGTGLFEILSSSEHILTNCTLENSGTVRLESGSILHFTFSFTPTDVRFLNTGIVEGSGEISLDSPIYLKNNGIISPGLEDTTADYYGQLAITGLTEQTSDTGSPGTIRAQISALTSFDRIDVAGEIAGGNIEILLPDGCSNLKNGDIFQPVSWQTGSADPTFTLPDTSNTGGCTLTGNILSDSLNNLKKLEISLTVPSIVISGLDGDTVTYSLMGNGALLDQGENATVDAIATDITGGTLDVTILNPDPAEKIEIRNQGTGPGQIGVDGGSILYGGILLGTASWDSSSGNMQIVFADNPDIVTNTTVAALVQSIMYHKQGIPTRLSDQTVRFVLKNKNNVSSAPADVTVKFLQNNLIPGTYYVNSVSGNNTLDGASEATAWKTLHYAIGQINIGQTGLYTLKVAPGTYSIANGEPDNNISVLKSGLVIEGLSETGAAIVDGTGTSYWRRGIDVRAGSVTIRNLAIRNFAGDDVDENWVHRGAIAFFAEGGGSAEGCVLENNYVGIYTSDNSPSIHANRISGGAKGIYAVSWNSASSPDIQNNLIYDFSNYGIYLDGYSGLTPSVLHNTLNGGAEATGIYISGETPSPDIRYNIISGSYNGIFSDAGEISGQYNLFWNNTGGNSGYTGTDDLSGDPLYEGDGSFRLQTGSPAVNIIPVTSGDPVTADFDGIVRPQGTGYDMGCYEVEEISGLTSTLTVTIEGSGSVTAAVFDANGDPVLPGDNINTGFTCPDICAGIYENTVTVKLTPQPDADYEFSEWNVGGVVMNGDSNDMLALPMSESRTVTAVFVPVVPDTVVLSLSVSPVGGGRISYPAPEGTSSSVTALSCPSDCSAEYPTGQNVTLTALPLPLYVFDKWEIDGEIFHGSPISITLDADTVATAYFRIPPSGEVDSDGDGVSDPFDICPFDPDDQCIAACELDSDDDGLNNCEDLCPLDPENQCDAVCDLDSDDDGLNDCEDLCPLDPENQCDAVCDLDSDDDGLNDCEDLCPLDPENQCDAVCDLDSDDDGLGDCEDPCPLDPENQCDAVCDQDSDDDGIGDCEDLCPLDPENQCDAVCDLDSDDDGMNDCDDPCPNDPENLCSGVCDKDSDDDGLGDCEDLCPLDPENQCDAVCDLDSDQDGMNDCDDPCPNDPENLCSNICDKDSDDDGFGDCEDLCPLDPENRCDAVCRLDSDDDGLGDCDDPCPNDPENLCNPACNLDSDDDGIPDCTDGCPNDADKAEPGNCGCGISDTADSDGDGTGDCEDQCPDDAAKTEPGVCGCGIADQDTSGDGLPDCAVVPSGIPVTVRPVNGAVSSRSSVALEAIFDTGGNAAVETYWRIRPVDNLSAIRTFIRNTWGGTVLYTVSDLKAGMQYIWQVGFRSPDTGSVIWSEEAYFTVGETGDYSGTSIPSGTLSSEYRMVSFPVWPEKPDAVSVLGDEIGTYDTRFFRIGSYNPLKNAYVEYGPDLEIRPGQACWVLAREGLNPVIRGIAVSAEQDIHVALDEGWNMIACPNERDYYWADLKVVVYDADFNIIFGPVSLEKLEQLRSEGNTAKAVDLRLWKWENDDYTAYTPLQRNTGAWLSRNEGYWIKAETGNVRIVFPEASQKDLSDVKNSLLVQTHDLERWIRRGLLSPDRAVAGDTDTPPLPPGGLSDDPSLRVDGGGGGCFVDSTY